MVAYSPIKPQNQIKITKMYTNSVIHQFFQSKGKFSVAENRERTTFKGRIRIDEGQRKEHFEETTKLRMTDVDIAKYSYLPVLHTNKGRKFLHFPLQAILKRTKRREKRRKRETDSFFNNPIYFPFVNLNIVVFQERKWWSFESGLHPKSCSSNR